MALFAYSSQTSGASAKVFRAQPGEFVVKFYKDKKHLAEANYFTDNKEDAIRTAKYVIDNWTK